jgi:hypothetical protein
LADDLFRCFLCKIRHITTYMVLIQMLKNKTVIKYSLRKWVQKSCINNCFTLIKLDRLFPFFAIIINVLMNVLNCMTNFGNLVPWTQCQFTNKSKVLEKRK